MKKPLILAALSGLVLVGAAYPDFNKPDDETKGIQSRGEPGQRYRPCRSRRDDRCIQLYERGVRARYARWLRDGDPGWNESVRYAVSDGRDRGRYGRGDDRRDHMHRDRHADHARHERHEEHVRFERRVRDEHAGHAAPQGRRGHPRLAMADTLRCDHVVPRPVARMPRPPQARPAPHPHPRPRMREDSGVRGM